MMFDLQSSGPHLRIPQQIHQQYPSEIAHPDTPTQPLLHQFLHGCPRLLDTCVAGRDFAVLVGEAGWVFDGGVDVFEGDGEVHDVEVEVVDAPVLELLFANGFDARAVVEGVPEFGDEEEVGAFDEAVFDGAGDALAGFDFVAVICDGSISECAFEGLMTWKYVWCL